MTQIIENELIRAQDEGVEGGDAAPAEETTPAEGAEEGDGEEGGSAAPESTPEAPASE
jgi:hypothetical protein